MPYGKPEADSGWRVIPFTLKIIECILGVTCLVIFRARNSNVTVTPETIGNPTDIAFTMVLCLYGFFAVNVTYPVAYLYGHTPSPQEMVFNFLSFILTVTCGGFSLREGGVWKNQDIFGLGVLLIIAAVVFLVDSLVILKKLDFADADDDDDDDPRA